MRAELEQAHGGLGGSRRFVRVLQLLGERPMSRVSRAIEACLRESLPSAEAVIQRTRSLAAIASPERDEAKTAFDAAGTARVEVPLPDLGRFDQLLCRPVESPISVLFA